jgi:quinol monooxygenase YgiN
MSVIMTLQLQADPGQLEEYAAANQDSMRGIAERAEERGVIAHRFYGSDDGHVMVVDEWPDAETFQSFFEEERAQIEPIMQAAGATSEPQITFWRKLETNDDIGWGA